MAATGPVSNQTKNQTDIEIVIVKGPRGETERRLSMLCMRDDLQL